MTIGREENVGGEVEASVKKKGIPCSYSFQAARQTDGWWAEKKPGSVEKGGKLKEIGAD